MTVTVLTTGGTIASADNGDGLGVDGGSELLEWLVGHTEHDDVVFREVLRRSSFDFPTAALCTLVREIVTVARSGQACVVTHGTDTMEETAFLTALYAPSGASVVFTGAQRGADDPYPDGPSNLADALTVARTAEASTGVLICFGGALVSGWHAHKGHTTAPNPFDGGEVGLVGRLDLGRLRLLQTSPPGGHFSGFAVPADLPRVELLTLVTGCDGAQLDALDRATVRGVVLEAFGIGNGNPAVVRAVRSLVTDGIPVVVSSRCGRGPVVPRYRNGGGMDLAAAGVAFAGELAGPQARLALMASLAHSDSVPAALTVFSEIAGQAMGVPA